MDCINEKEKNSSDKILEKSLKKGRRSSLRLKKLEVQKDDTTVPNTTPAIGTPQQLEVNSFVRKGPNIDICDTNLTKKPNQLCRSITPGPLSLPPPVEAAPLHSSTPTSLGTASLCTDENVVSHTDFISARDLINQTTSKVKDDEKSEIEDTSPRTTPSASQLLISEWGLPSSVQESYKEKGITSMFPWQVECLMVNDGKVLEGGNLVYSAPTSAGKTLVAEMLMMKRVFETGKKALLILPFVSLAREKMFHLQSLLREAGLRVEGFMGSQSPAGGLKTTDIGVATIEKANSLVNRLMEEGQLESIGCVVVDELHMLGDKSRGYLLELLLTKILYVSGSSVQIIGMSATLPNLSDLSTWLKASLYTTTFRPVPLTEMVKIGTTLLDTNLQPVGAVLPPISISNDTEHITWLCLETILETHSVLLFCPIKSWVEKLAETLANDFFQIGRPDPHDQDHVSMSIRAKLQGELSGEKLGEVIEQLRRCPAGLDPSMAKVLRVGVAFHHAGLTTDERDIVEAGFKSGVVRVLVATSTLSSGVNLPARRVILRCPLTYNGQLMDKLQYKQMVGRAGRKGVDTKGESIMICKPAEKERVGELVQGCAEPVLSCLAGGGSALAGSMKRAILEVIVSGAATTREDVERYAGCTLLAAQLQNTGEGNIILECVEFLESGEFIKQQEVSGSVRYVATRLGLACLASSLSPDEGLSVFSELRKARRQFVLENELHIIYLIVPIYAAVSWPKLDWMGFLTMWEGLSEDMRRVGSIVGVEERWMVRAMRGTLRMTDQEQRRSLAIHQRFYTALALHDLVHEMPLAAVATKYGATKGMLQGLQQAASTFAGMVTVFSAKLGWNNMELLVGQFQDRLEFGVQRELIELCRLASMDGARARMLFDAGLETVAALAAAKVEDVENVLHASTAFSSRKEDGKGEERRKLKNIFISGLPAMTEEDCAKLMVKEARAVMKRDLGLSSDAWVEEGKKVSSNNPVDHDLPKVSPGAPKVTPASIKVTPGGTKVTPGGTKVTPGRRGRRSSGCKVTPPSVNISPHLKYQLESCQPANLTQIVQRKIISPQTITGNKNSARISPQLNNNTDVEEVLTSKQCHSPSVPGEGKEKTRANQLVQELCNGKDSSPALKERPITMNSIVQEEDKREVNGVKRSNSSQAANKVMRRSETHTSPNNLESSTSDLFNISGMSDTFDMSSVMEDIFNAEMEGGTVKKGRKKVSWGDEKEGLLVMEKEITQTDKENSDPSHQDVTGDGNDILDITEENDNKVESYVPKTPKFKVCSEELDLHWSESDSSLFETEDNLDVGTCENTFDKSEASDSVNEIQGGEAKSACSPLDDGMKSGRDANNDSEDVFGETISDSFLDRAMDQQQPARIGRMEESKRGCLSPGMAQALADMDSQVEFCSFGGVDTLTVDSMAGHGVSQFRRRKKKGKAGKKVKESLSPGLMILSDESEEDDGQDLCVVDVCSKKEIFSQFVKEWKAIKSYSMAVAVDRCKDRLMEDKMIGNTRSASQAREQSKLFVETGVIVGIAVSWSGLTVYYISLVDGELAGLNDSLAPPSQDPGISIETRLSAVCEAMEGGAKVTALSWRRQASLLYTVTGRILSGTHSDPAIAAWLLDPSSSQSTLSKLVLDHCPHLTPILPTLGSGPGHGSLAANPAASNQPRYRALAEAVLVNNITRELEKMLEKAKLLNHYHEVEMKCDTVLMKMELTGMGLNEREYEDTRLLLETRLRIVEESAYRLAGRHFSLSSPPDICKVLYHELRLPVNGDPKLGLRNVRSGRGGVKLSASKEILEKLIAKDYQLPALILEHRRLSSAISRTVAPLLTVCQVHPILSVPRVYPTCVTHTATGRVSLHEPNLQNIPKSFQVELTEDLKKKALGRRPSSRRRTNSSSLALTPLARLLAPADPSTTVSLRHAIIPVEGNLLLSADYSQLELRVLAHLSNDTTLQETLRQGGDVFKSMAAEINRCKVEEVTDTMRQQAKQIVYGLIYGIGDSSLADQLGVEQMEAVRFTEGFKTRYPGVRSFLQQCVTTARKTGCVETMSGRKRRLEDINHQNMARRTAAERQAVNTRVQGSAADLVKAAMVMVEKEFMVAWPDCRPLKWSRAREGRWEEKEMRGAWLALQLHDELIYEVSGEDVVQAALIVREGMEGALKFSVPLPVRLKVGATWGSLQEFSI